MKFVIILALLCLCYAEVQSTTTDSAVGREPPKHIKDFVEQHIKHVKQQIPIIQQQIKEGKVHVEIAKPVVNSQQVPEHIKQFINTHINQILQHVANKKQVKQLHVTLETTPSLGVPQFVVDKINKLQDHVKQIMQQAETHIPQIINQQIAYKQKIKNKETVPEVIVEKKVSRRSVTTTPKEQIGNVGVKPVVVPTLVQDIVQQVHQHVPQVVAQHVAQVHKENVEKQQVVVPAKVQGIVEQIHQHLPQVIQHHHQNVDHQIKTRSIKDEVKVTETEKKQVVVPAKVQGVVEQIHQHVPQVIQHHHQNVDHQIKTRSIKDEVKVTETPKEQKDVVDIKPVLVPHAVQAVVEQVHQHVPQVVSQVQKQNVEKRQVVVPPHIQGIVEQVHQHVPQVVSQVQKQNVEKKQVVVPPHIQGIVQQVHQHVPQVVSQVQKQNVEKRQVVVPPHIQGIVEQVHQHVPQLINHHKNQLEKKDIPSTIQPNTQIVHTQVVMKENAQLPSDIHSIVTKIHKHVPQNVQHVDKHNTVIEPSKVQKIQNLVVPVRLTD